MALQNSNVHTSSVGASICSRNSLLNKYNLLRSFVLFLTLILSSFCFLYGVGSLLTLSFEDLYCDNDYTWDEITQYNRENNYQFGIGGCYRSDTIIYDENKVFSTDVSNNALIVEFTTFNKYTIVTSSVFATLTVILMSMFIFYCRICIIDCRRTCLGSNSTNGIRSEIEAQYCCIGSNKCWKNIICCKITCLWQKYVNFTMVTKKLTQSDSPSSIIRMKIKELLEIALQSVAFYYYAGSQNNFIKAINSGRWENLDDIVILSEKIEYVTLFSYVLSLDCIIIGILWLLFLFKHNIFHGRFFQYLLFSIDLIFDMFYATFPLWLISNNKNFSFFIAAASVNSQSLIIFIATVLPVTYMTLRMWRMLVLLSNFAIQQNRVSFPSIEHNNNNNNNNIQLEAIHMRSGKRYPVTLVNNVSNNSQVGDIAIEESRLPNFKSSIRTGAYNKENNNNDYNSGTHNKKGGKCCGVCCYGDKYFIYPTSEIPSYKQDKKTCTIQYYRRIITFIIGMSSIAWGVLLYLQIRNHVTNSINICNEYNRNTNGFNFSYPHLYAWPQCQYKVYPISDDDSVPCQCRNLIVESSDSDLWYNNDNLNSNEMTLIFENILLNYYMLETLKYDGSEFGYSNKLNLTDNMLIAKNLNILHIGKMTFGEFSSNFGNKMKELEFIKMDLVLVESSINSDSWKYMTKLKWISLVNGWFIWQNETIDWVCNLESLKYLSISAVFNKNVKTPICLTRNNDIRNGLKYVLNEYSDNFDIRILLGDNLFGGDFYGSDMNTSILEKQLIQVDNGTSDHWERIMTRKLYLQESRICDEWNYDYYGDNVTYQDIYPLTSKLIMVTNACDQVCNDQFGCANCRNIWWHDGYCDSICNTAACGYDGGDCTQLCDYTKCNYTSLGDGICNPACRNEDCLFDYCDCFNDINDIYNINYNVTQAEITQCLGLNNTYCEINTNCNSSWIDDNICDQSCNNIYCNYDNGHCNSCESSLLCNTFWTYFEALSTSEIKDYLASQSELCSLWNIIHSITKNNINLNCTQTISLYDRNNDTMLNGYEAMIFMYQSLYGTNQENDNKLWQLNCSLCAPSIDIYYAHG